MRTMSMWCAAAACAAMAGCEYTVPVADKPSGNADAALVGAWTRTQNAATERLVVLPVSKREWMVCFSAETRDAMFARAWPVRAAGKDLVQLRWLGTARGQLPEDGKVYQLAAFSIEGDTLTVRMVNGIGADAATTRDLVDVLGSNKDRADFFREAMVFQRAKE